MSRGGAIEFFAPRLIFILKKGGVQEIPGIISIESNYLRYLLKVITRMLLGITIIRYYLLPRVNTTANNRGNYFRNFISSLLLLTLRSLASLSLIPIKKWVWVGFAWSVAYSWNTWKYTGLDFLIQSCQVRKSREEREREGRGKKRHAQITNTSFCSKWRKGKVIRVYGKSTSLQAQHFASLLHPPLLSENISFPFFYSFSAFLFLLSLLFSSVPPSVTFPFK